MSFVSNEAKAGDDSLPRASQALVELASESWRLDRQVARALASMDPFEAERFASSYAWYQRVVATVLDEAGLRAVDVTGTAYDVGMAVTPLNLDDFPRYQDGAYRVAEMIEPIIMEHGSVRKMGTVMLSEDLEAL